MGINVFGKYYPKIFLSLLVFAVIILLNYDYLLITTYFARIRAQDDKNLREYPSKPNEFLASELSVDQNPESQAVIVRKAQQVLRNFPISFWENNKNGRLRPKTYKSCAIFPKVYDVEVNNLYWQVLPVDKGNIYFYSAFYDVRNRCPICPAVRVLAMVDPQAVIPNKTYCQIWFDDNEEPIIVEGKYDRLVTWGRLFPYMISCSIKGTPAERIPICVSVVNNKCDRATNSLRVIFNRPADGRKKGFAVCVKHTNFLHVDMSLMLIEWIELLRLLGAEKITFYPLHVHENMTKVFKYYEERDVVEIVPTTLAGNQPNAPYFQHLYFMNRAHWTRTFGNEVLEVNDCFYRNMYKYDYIVPLDIDEVIIPNKATNWAGLMNNILREASSTGRNNAASYCTVMVIFPNCPNMSVYNDIPAYMYMLQHVLADKDRRIINPTLKSFLDTEVAFAAHNHFAIRSFSERRLYHVRREDAELYHYRQSPYEAGRSWRCQSLIENKSIITTLWRYKKSLINCTLAALYSLGFYGQDHGL